MASPEYLDVRTVCSPQLREVKVVGGGRESEVELIDIMAIVVVASSGPTPLTVGGGRPSNVLARNSGQCWQRLQNVRLPAWEGDGEPHPIELNECEQKVAELKQHQHVPVK